MSPQAPPGPVCDDGAGDALRATRVILRPVANPMALGFFGLAAAALVSSGTDLGWVARDDHLLTGLLIIATAPVLQLVASVFGFLARDALTATGMGVMAAGWLCVGVTTALGEAGGGARPLALVLFVAAAAGVLSGAATASVKAVPAAVLLLTGTHFGLTGVSEMGVADAWRTVAGWSGIGLCALAIYAAVSIELEELRHRTVLPTGRRGSGRGALQGGLDEQVEQVANEAGVRAEL